MADALKEITAGYGAEALDALRDVVADLKSGDPLTPVTVLAPSNTAGIGARRHLAAHGGVAALQVTTLPRLAETLAAHRLTPRRPATRTVIAAAWRQALLPNPGVFAEVADHPTTIAALARAHTDLRDLASRRLDLVGANGELVRDLVRLHREVEELLAPDWYDQVDLLGAATTALDSFRDKVVLYLPQRLTRHEQELVDSLAVRTDVVVIRGAQVTECATKVLHASDSDDEVRWVVREVVAALSQEHRVAVLYADRSPYARLLGEQLAAAGVAWNGPGTRQVSERGTARAFLDLLALAEDEVPRASLFEALGGISVTDFDGNRIPLSRWERISRAAGVVRGGHWDTRLQGWIAALDSEKAWDQPYAESLRAFAMRLQHELARDHADWASLADWARWLFETLLVDDHRLAKLPPEEQHASISLRIALRGMSTLDSSSTPPTLRTLHEILDLELGSALPRVGRFGDGVYVGPLSSAVGLDADVTFVVGLSEDLYPGNVRDDALLPDRIRTQLDGALPTLRDRIEEKHQHLLAAFASAPTVIASFPRGDLRQTKGRLPSRWLLPTLRELSGKGRLPATEWETTSDTEGVVAARSFTSGITEADTLATEQEWRVRAALAGVLTDDMVDTARVMLESRASDAFTRFDGNLAGVEGLPDYRVSDEAISPTALEQYAGCPYAFFVERLLGVRPLENPEDIVKIPASELGTFIHQCFDDLIKRCAEDLPGPGQPWTEEQRAALQEIAADKAVAFEERGVTGHERLWTVDRAKILRTLDDMLSVDDGWRASRGAAIRDTELSFGLDPALDDDISVPVTGGRVRMRGSADLVCESDGKLYVIDIKTGSKKSFSAITQDDPMPKGAKLQLPAYALATRARYGEDLPVEASYWFVHKESGRVELSVDDTVLHHYGRVLGVLTSGIASGHFPSQPPKDDDFMFVQCDYCNPDGLGYAGRRREWEAKQERPELAQLVGLIVENVVDDD